METQKTDTVVASPLQKLAIKPCRFCGDKPDEYQQGSEKIGFTDMVTCSNKECAAWGTPVGKKMWQEAEAL